MTADSASAEFPAFKLLGRAAQHELFVVFLAALLCLVGFYALWLGYLNTADLHSNAPRTRPFLPIIIPIFLIWIFGIYLARKHTPLIWLWVSWLALWALGNIMRSRGYVCSWCDPGVDVLVFVTVVWIGLVAAARFIARMLQTEYRRYFAWWARREVLTVTAAVVLYGISDRALLWGSVDLEYAQNGPRLFDPGMAVLFLIGLAGVYITRRTPIVPWIWVAFLASWTYSNFYYYWTGLFFIDGRRGCVACEDMTLSLLLFTAIWVPVAMLSFGVMSLIRAGETK
jgi:hypothetical protein